MPCPSQLANCLCSPTEALMFSVLVTAAVILLAILGIGEHSRCVCTAFHCATWW